MSIYERVGHLPSGADPLVDKIPVHQFGALMGEFERLVLNKPQVVAKLENAGHSLTIQEKNQLQVLGNLLRNNPNNPDGILTKNTSVHVEHLFILVEGGYYTKQEALNSLGLTE